MVTRLIQCFAIIFLVQGCTSSPPITSISVEIGNETFQLELAVDEASRVQGLMFRAEIPPHEGMIFVFPDVAERSFWMKNCLVDIDIIFLDTRGTVTAVHTMLSEPPKSPSESETAYGERLQHYWSHGPAKFAIEVASGTFKRLGIRVNDRVNLDLPMLKRMAR